MLSFLFVVPLLSASLSISTSAHSEDDVTDGTSLFQKPLTKLVKTSGYSTEAPKPHLIPLRRESVPIYRRGKVASFKTSYSGVLHVGSPAQEFRVVFDTGSGNIVVPAVECMSESCIMHRTYNMSASSSAVAINMDGSPLQDGELTDQVTIGFGTGEITGEFTRDRVCVVGSPANDTVAQEESGAAPAAADSVCLDMNVIVAVEMTSQPFKTFQFDGIFGLGLNALAMSDEFSAFGMLSRSAHKPQFGVFLTEGEEGDVSEIAFGGHNPSRLLEPLTWAPVAMADHGYWQVEIVAVRIGGQLQDICEDGTCRGVVDTGTSHLGFPAAFNKHAIDLLSRDAGDLLDCRLADAPEVQIELRGYNITLYPHNYMRRLPLREGVSVGSAHGVHMNSSNNASAGASKGTENSTSTQPVASAPSQGNAISEADAADPSVRRFCNPRTMPVTLPEPLGPKLFILGEPVLHRYYTVYDWQTRHVGFGLANNVRNTNPTVSTTGALPKEVDMLLMQQSVKRSPSSSISRVGAGTRSLDEEDEVENSVLLQVQVTFVRQRIKK